MRRYFDTIERERDDLYAYLFARSARKEFGSVDGRIASLGTDYDQPSVILKDQNTGREFPCRVDPAVVAEIRETMTAGNVWDHQRVRVSGILNFDKDGNIIRIYDGKIRFLDVEPIAAGELSDRHFTSGYTVAEYLDRFREGDLG